MRAGGTRRRLLGGGRSGSNRFLGRRVSLRPRQQRAVRIGRISGSQKLNIHRLSPGPQAAQHVHRRGNGELCGTQTGNKHSTTHQAAVFHGFQRRVNGGIAAGNAFGNRGFSQNNAMSHQQLVRKVRAPFGNADWRNQLLAKQRPSPLRRAAHARTETPHKVRRARRQPALLLVFSLRLASSQQLT